MSKNMIEVVATENAPENKHTEKNILEIFIASHCSVCDYTQEIYEIIRHRFPAVIVRLIAIDQPDVSVPEIVFATPTYLLNGKIWSLGNPSLEQIERTFVECQTTLC